MNLRYTLLSFLLIASCAIANAGKVVYSYDSTLSFTEDTDCGKIEITFKRCMANNLYTFYTVKLNGQEVNSASVSDNIGPFCIYGGTWIGGNHDFNGTPNANTVDVSVSIDGSKIANAGTYTGNVIDIKVHNEIFYSDKNKFCDEYMSYRVSGNTIEVWGKHNYTYPSPITIAIYYGMQSMFINDFEVLTPGGKYNRWNQYVVINSGNEQRFNKGPYPNFCTFIEHSARGYQASYLTKDGIGDHSMVNDNDYAFIGNSWSKSYHKLIGNRTVKNGDETNWHGLYTWFNEPVTDTFRDTSVSEPIFEYTAYINGKKTTMHLDAQGKMTPDASGVGTTIADGSKTPLAFASNGKITISDMAPQACCYTLLGTLVHKGSGTFNCTPGVYIVSDMRGKSVKLIVR